MTRTRKISRALHALLAAPLLVLAISSAQAAPITSDLSINGSIAFSSAYAAGQLAGDGTQRGQLSSLLGGSTSSTSFTGSATTGSNPLTGTLSAIGDGFGFSGAVSASAANLDSSFGIGIDLGLNLKNNSATDTYKLTFNVQFDHAVDATGANAFVDSNFYVRNKASTSPVDIFYTDLYSDTVNGNEIGGVPTGGFGGPLTDSGLAAFMLTLLPGQSIIFDPSIFELSWTLRGGAFTDPASSASASLDAFVSIAAVENLTTPPNPNPVPAPATLLLVVLGAAAMRMLRRNASS